MALTINTNISSLNAQRNLGKSQNDLSQSMERLSSGLRINSAKDDAAGLAISDRMTAQIRGLNQASRNANDGISMAQTAEGALQESTNILQRMRELAVQSANDTNSASDRASLNEEISQLKAEIDRIAKTSEFNGRKVIDGTMKNATFQVGANAGVNQTISFSIDSALAADLSSDGTVVAAPNGTPVTGTDVTGSLSAGELIVNGNDVGIVAQEAKALAAAITAADSSVTATAANAQSLEFTDITVSTAATVNNAAVTQDAAITSGELNINGFEITSATGDATAIAAAINNAGAGVTATADNTVVTSALGGTNHIINKDADDVGTTATFSFDLTVNGTTKTITIAADDAASDIDLDNQTQVDKITAAIATQFGAAGIAVTTDGTDLTFTAGGSLAGASLTIGASSFTNAAAGEDTSLTAVAITRGTYDLASDSSAGIAISGTGSAKAGLTNTTNTYQVVLNDGTTDTTISFDANVDGNKDGQVTSFEVAAAITANGTYTATVNADTGNIDIAKTIDDGTNMTITETLNGVAGNGFTSGSADTHYGSISLDSAADIIFTGTAQGLVDAGLTAAGSTTTTIDLLSVDTRENAWIAIASVDAALEDIDTIRGGLGAVQNRFESTISNLNNVSENLSAARSRILDADIAMETSAMTKNNILQQAGVSILAQANQTPQLALSLLQG
ncbi:MAG: flagellin [Desulforhopalus sp.]